MNSILLRNAVLNRKRITLALVSCFATSCALANPSGPSVISGNAIFNQQGNLLSITNSPNAILNWRYFSIGANEITRFNQQSAASAILNRVVGVDPSIILGTMQSNGRVFLINSNGILFGAGARIDVAGLVASTLNLSDIDFLAGRLRFTDTPGAGGIHNQGAITTPTGGQVYLIAPNVQNSGIITSPRGEVILAAGKSVELVDPGTPNLSVKITAPATEALNVGNIIAHSGKIGIYAGLITNSGTIEADGVVVGQNGEIQLRATGTVTLEAGSVISASGAPGAVQGGGTVRIVAEDTLDFQRGARIRVDGGADGGNGGFLELSGHNRILLGGTYSGRALAPGFTGGTLLFDPADIDVTTGVCLVSLCLDPTPVTGAFYGFTNYVADATNDLRVLSPIVHASLNSGNPGGSLTLNAGNDLTINAPIGSAATRFDHDLTLRAGNDVIVNDSIYLGVRTLTMAADATIPSVGAVSDGVGDVMILPTVGPVVVDTLGSIKVSGVNFNVGTSVTTYQTTVKAGVDLTVNVTGKMSLEAGELTGVGDASVLVSAGNNIVINAGGEVSVTAGSAELSSNGTSLANATLSAGNDMQITADSVTVKGGTGQAQSSGGSSLSAADATITAGRDLTLILGAGGLEVAGGNIGTDGVSGAIANGGTASASGNARVSAGRDINATINGLFEIESGNAGDETPTAGALANAGVAKASADAVFSAGRNLNVTVTGGDWAIDAGDAVATAGGASGINTALATANVIISAGTQMNVTVSGGGSIGAKRRRGRCRYLGGRREQRPG